MLQEDVMQLRKRLHKSLFGKAALAAVALAGTLFLAGAPSAQARDWDGHRVIVRSELRVRGPVFVERRPIFVERRPVYSYYAPVPVYRVYRDRFGCLHRY